MKTLHNLDLALDSAYQQVAQHFLQEARALLAPFNLRRHPIRITHTGLQVGDQCYWELKQRDTPLLVALFDIGATVQESDNRLFNLLQGHTL